ncbi:MAG: HAD family hydrolase, partial [Nitrospira sp. NTP1]|nr:HAD family hydrolase [Nitrospira sp. NTP1]
HYATDPEVLRTFPAADLSIDRIGELLTLDRNALLAAAKSGT